MNKHIIWGLLAMIIASCSNDEMAEIAKMKQAEIAVTAGLTSNTRINFEQEGDVVYAHWDSDDQITLYADSQGDLDYQVSYIDDAGTTASFSAVKDVLQNTDEVIYATYPATMITDGVATLPVTSVWSDTRDMSFAYAVGNVTDGKVDLQFKHLYAYLKLTLNAETVSGIDTNEISGLWITNSSGDWISTNSGTYDFNTQTYTITEGTNCMIIEFEETFVADGDAEKVVYIPIIPLGAGKTINLSVLHEDETGCDTLHIISKDTPESGFEAGRVYTYSLAAPFTKEGNSITLKVAGTLSQAISAETKDTITSLKISGPLNGDDIRFIREMAGRDVSGNETDGQLVDLDMSEASIVEGGDYYYQHRFTSSHLEKYSTHNNDIGEFMFFETNLKKCICPHNVTSIGQRAFAGCASLTDIIIPEGLTYLGIYAFADCVSLPNFIIPNGISSLEMGLFYDCSSMKNITLHNSIISIGSQVFCGCSSLMDITIPNSVNSIGAEAFSNCSSLKTIEIPQNITLIESQTFRGCSSLINFILPDGVTSIGDFAFDRCTSLTSITIPDGVTSIAYSAFAHCTSLTSITIPDGVTSIGNSVFAHCTSLTSITIPDGVTSIAYSAFAHCTSLSEVTCNAANPPTLEEDAFYYISSPSTLIVPTGCTSAYSESDWASYFTTIKGENDTEGNNGDIDDLPANEW